ncbi:hypothetical protein [Sphingomicrobium nitratireducens]|uniref:hypothetical protein n=1 Tax=Sphingomicrobium nitratireducens TaxID=2964666 RepID=UPI002240CA47|nr:hypothetical protein [Sphingomicrobium nitratireducens]
MHKDDPIRVSRRFTGPDGIGNGGYVAGLVSEAVGGPTKCRLHAPTPLETDLHLEVEDGIARLLKDGRVLVEAEPLGKPLDLDPIPAKPTEEEIEVASGRFPGADEHMAPNCFVCGIDRDPEDALCIFAGESTHRDVSVADWVPNEDLAGSDGHVRTRYVYAALDCPTYFALGRTHRTALLAGFAVRIERPIAPGEKLTVTAWPLEHEGRKYHAGSVIHDEAGHAIALARALWIDVGSVGDRPRG